MVLRGLSGLGRKQGAEALVSKVLVLASVWLLAALQHMWSMFASPHVRAKPGCIPPRRGPMPAEWVSVVLRQRHGG